MTMLKPEYVVTALVLNLFGGFIIASIINPYEVDREHDMVEVQEEDPLPVPLPYHVLDRLHKD